MGKRTDQAGSGIEDSEALAASAHLDDVDKRIIAILQVDGRRSYAAIAAEVGVSEGTVRARVQRLLSASLLQVVGISDPLRLGFGSMAMVGLRVAPTYMDSVAEAMAKLPETSYVASTTGRFDVMAEVICRDTAAFRQVLNTIHEIEGVNSAESFMLLEIHKLAYGWGVGQTADGTKVGGGPQGPRRTRRRGAGANGSARHG